MSDPDVELHEVGAVEDFPLDTAQVVQLGRRPVAVFNVGGTLYACKDLCPHQGDPLHVGRIEAGAVICPGHDWKFDLASGECVGGGGVAVQSHVTTFPVRIVDGRVYLER